MKPEKEDEKFLISTSAPVVLLMLYKRVLLPLVKAYKPCC